MTGMALLYRYRNMTTTLIGKVPRWKKWSPTTGRGGLQKPSSFGNEVPPWIWTVDFSSQQYGTPSLTNCSPLFLHNCFPPFLPIYSPISCHSHFLSWCHLFLLSIYWTTFTLIFSLLGWRRLSRCHICSCITANLKECCSAPSEDTAGTLFLALPQSSNVLKNSGSVTYVQQIVMASLQRFHCDNSLKLYSLLGLIWSESFRICFERQEMSADVCWNHLHSFGTIATCVRVYFMHSSCTFF